MEKINLEVLVSFYFEKYLLGQLFLVRKKVSKISPDENAFISISKWFAVPQGDDFSYQGLDLFQQLIIMHSTILTLLDHLIFDKNVQ